LLDSTIERNDQMQADVTYPKPSKGRKRKLDSGNGLPCQSILDLQSQFQEQWETNLQLLIPEKLSAEFLFDGTAAIAATRLTDEIRSAYGMGPAAQTGAMETPIEIDVRAALLLVSDASLKKKRQRSVCKEILRAIAAIDGYHYSETGSVDSKTGDGFHFRFVCVDSFDNKERAANKRRKAQENAERDDSESEPQKAPTVVKKEGRNCTFKAPLSRFRYCSIHCKFDI
jgi:hypothetical protein